MNLTYEFKRLEEKFLLWLSNNIPKKLLYWCFITGLALATTGKYGDTVVTELDSMEALKRVGVATGMEVDHSV